LGNSGLTIRDARQEELGEVSQILKEAYQEYEKFLSPERWKSYLKDIMDVCSRLDESELIVAELNGRLWGSVTLYSDSSRMQVWPEGWAGIRLLAVCPSYRNQGIGRALMEECISRCRRKGIIAIGLHTTEIMKIARGMYETMGFLRAPEFDFHPAPGIIVMAYRLKL
jgi:GNAT superfamily N-acetyltransferase